MLISKQRRENDLFSNFLNIDTADAVLTFDFIKKRKRYKYLILNKSMLYNILVDREKCIVSSIH